MLHIMIVLCGRWLLVLKKTKVMIFSRGQCRNNLNFTYNGLSLEVVILIIDIWVLILTIMENLMKARDILNTHKKLCRPTVFLRKRKNLCLLINVQLHLFDHYDNTNFARWIWSMEL